MRGKTPITFDDFFEIGFEDHVSPFLTPQAKRWGVALTFKAALLSALLLALAYLFAFTENFQSFSTLCLLGVYFFAGVPALIESVEDLYNLELNIDVLMTLAAFCSVLIGSPLEGGMLLVLFAISGSMEDAVTNKAKGSISALYKLSPSTVSIYDENGELHERSIKDVLVGEKILIKAGEITPLDGRIEKGSTTLNLVHLTGESAAIPKTTGETVPAGAQNIDGVIVVTVIRTEAESTVSRIIKLVTEAQEAKPKVERFFDKLSKPYATTVISLTAFFALVLPYIFSIPFLGEEGSVYRSIAFLIAASPCALIIATPIAYLSSISSCAKKGVLLKGGITLDAISRCKAIAFDKTGTLTTGSLKLIPEEFDSTLPLEIAYALERGAVHPIARGIISYAKEQNIKPYNLDNFTAEPGFGLKAVATINGTKTAVRIGSAEFIAQKLDDSEKGALEEKISICKERGEIIGVLLIDKEVTLFRFEDTARDNLLSTIDSLKKEQLELVMLTGDHEKSAKRIADTFGIDHYISGLKPEDKLRHVSKIADEKGLIMVGDGINDSPALTRATVGISMGKAGSTSAIEAADVVLLHDNLERIPFLISKANATQKIVTQNLTLAASVILLATTPALLGFIPLWLAVILHEGGTILVGLNALRLLR